MSIPRALIRRAESEITAYVFATILKPGRNRSRRLFTWRAWLAVAVLLVGLVLAIIGD
jgi:steroid 5-alpha reductase family enzyme